MLFTYFWHLSLKNFWSSVNYEVHMRHVFKLQVFNFILKGILISFDKTFLYIDGQTVPQ